LGTNSFVSQPAVNLGYAATVFAASLSQLSSFLTLGPLTEGGYQTGQQAYVNSTGQIFVLRSALPGAANGVNVLRPSVRPATLGIAN
jgi:hypothetical protein